VYVVLAQDCVHQFNSYVMVYVIGEQLAVNSVEFSVGINTHVLYHSEHVISIGLAIHSVSLLNLEQVLHSEGIDLTQVPKLNVAGKSFLKIAYTVVFSVNVIEDNPV